MSIVVTGGAGFVGSHVTDAYLAMGHHVFVIDNFITGSRENISHHLDNDRLHGSDWVSSRTIQSSRSISRTPFSDLA